jgi:hypothetical protein
MTDKISGGCACGAIRYECSKPILMFLCHCRDCQRASGSAFIPVVVVPAVAFKITQGTPTWYEVERLRGGHNRRGFCPACGSRLFGGGTDRTQGITASSFDDSSFYKPTGHAFATQAPPWDVMDPSLPKFDDYLPRP